MDCTLGMFDLLGPRCLSAAQLPTFPTGRSAVLSRSQRSLHQTREEKDSTFIYSLHFPHTTYIFKTERINKIQQIDDIINRQLN